MIVASKRFDGNYANMYYFYNYDARGSVTSIINPEGGLVKGYDYDEFGQTKETGDALFKNDVKFTGAVHDQSSNLYYMNARFYNPSTGRFLTQDSYKGNAYEPWTQHLYVYTGNNPVNYVDPTGHRAIYAFDPDAETDEQRETSLWAMHGYNNRDSYKIATAKTTKKKTELAKELPKQKERVEAANKTQAIATAVTVTTSAVSTVATGLGKVFREWIVLGGGVEREYLFKTIGGLGFASIVAGVAAGFNARGIEKTYEAGMITSSERFWLHVSNVGFAVAGVAAGVMVGAFTASVLPALIVGGIAAGILYGAQKFVDNKLILKN